VTAITDTYAATVEQLAADAERTMGALWDGLGSWDEIDSDAFRSAAKPYLRGVAQASVRAAETYALEITGVVPEPSDLLVDDAAARVLDAFDRYASMLTEQVGWSDAVKAGGRVARNIGHDTAFRSARLSLGQLPGTDWQRRVTGKSCDWCLSFARVTFPTAAAASFGHDRCDCLVVPVSESASHNERVLGDREFDPETYSQRQSLQKQVRTAKRRQEEARRAQITEPDPARRERLSIREQEWETRAEFATERLQLLTQR
jgi:hypothetical protein